MSEPNYPKEHPSTYIVQDRQNREELQRLIIQDHMLTEAMGGVLPEQSDPISLRRVLDVGCGSGTWVIEAAQKYPEMQLVGIDISQRMIKHAQAQATIDQVETRVEFQVMDALRMLEFPSSRFDLVNLRLGVSFLRIWDWPKLMQEMMRITRAGGTLRLTETTLCPIHCSSDALLQLFTMLVAAFQQAGHLFQPKDTGITEHLEPWLKRYGCQQVQVRKYERITRGSTEGGRLYCEDTQHLFRTSRPFLQKWGGYRDEEIEGLYQQASQDMAHPDFEVEGIIVTAWGKKPAHQ